MEEKIEVKSYLRRLCCEIAKCFALFTLIRFLGCHSARKLVDQILLSMKVIILCFILFFYLNISKADEGYNNVEFDYKCLLCKWTAQLIITYHAKGDSPHRLFSLLTTLCSYLGDIDKVNIFFCIIKNMHINIHTNKCY